MIKKSLPYILAGLTGLLFIFSGVVKLFPIQLFEFQIVSQHLSSYALVPFLSRGLISFEICLGILLLQRASLKKIVIPAAIALLVIFSVYLIISIILKTGGSNCGCFGQVLPMSVTSALIKNIFLIGLLVFAYIKIENDRAGRLYIPVVLFVCAFIGIALLFPIKKYEEPIVAKTTVVIPDTTRKPEIIESPAPKHKDSTQVKTKPEPVVITPAVQKGTSIYSAYSSFNSSKGVVKVDVNDGRKIIAVLSLDCDHCMAAATEIAKLKTKGFPQVYALFYGEEKDVQPFFAQTGLTVPYIILEPEKFFPLLTKSPPRITLLNYGNVVGDWNGDEFKIEELVQKLGITNR